MHILKIIHGYPPEYNAGSEVYTQSICNELTKYHKVTVFSREENPYKPDFELRYKRETENLDFYLVNMAQGKDGFRHRELDERFAGLISRIQPDVAHIGHLNHLSTGIVDELNKQNIPVVFTLHDFWLMCPRGQFLQRNSDGKQVWQLCDIQNHYNCATICYKPLHSGHRRQADKQINRNIQNQFQSSPDGLNDEEYWKSWIEARMTETLAIVDKVDLFISPSNYLRNRFIDDFGLPKSKIIYLDYGFPTEYLTQTEKSSENNEFTFGYIGTHLPAKGLNQLIEAFKQVQGPSTLKIFGRNNGQSTAALKQLAATSKNRIDFAGEYINNNLANDVFSKVDCIVVPSIWAENSPLVIHEAQACKIPVITADFGGMKEFVQHRVNGLLFEHRNVSSLTEQMNFAAQHPLLMNQLGQKGYLYSDDGRIPDIREHCKDLEGIYKNVGKKKLWRLTLDTNPEDCNLHCIMCEEHSPYSNFIPELLRSTGLKRRRMSQELIESIFDQAAEIGIKEVIPSTMGEPLLYEGIDNFFKWAQKYQIKINLTTNGTFPGRKVEDWANLILPNTIDVKISWNGTAASTAEKIMTGLNYEKNLRNIKHFIAERNRYFAQTGYYCRVTFQVTFMLINAEELADIVKLAAGLGVDRVKGHHLWIHFKEMEKMSMTTNNKNAGKWNECVKKALEARELYRRPDGTRIILENFVSLTQLECQEVPENYDCPFLGKELWISATGKISPCCAPDSLRDSLGDFGSISERKIQGVFYSKDYQNLIRNYKRYDLCKKCLMRKQMAG